MAVARSRMPFVVWLLTKKLIFTGSTNVGKTVMSAAAENLVPLILELGGKSPVSVHPSIHLRDVAQRIAAGKLWNAGRNLRCT